MENVVSVKVKNPIDNFLYVLRAPETKRKYPQRLKFFFDYVLPAFKDQDLQTQAMEFIKLGRGNSDFVYDSFLSFITTQNKRIDKKEITAGTVRNYYKAAKLFCEMNNVLTNWKMISKGLAKEKEYGEDRAPTREEIIQLMKYPDRRIKTIILVMATSGIRAGAWDYLKWKHIVPIERYGKIVAAKLIVYGGEQGSYFTFITPEAYHACNEWMEFRESFGEKITGDSWLVRDLWQTTHTHTHQSSKFGIGLVSYPKQLRSKGVKSLMERALKTQGVEKIMKEGVNHNTRREWKVLHGFRKFFNSVLVNADVNFTKKERLMGHDTGLDNNYFKPKDNDLLDAYLTVVNELTLNEEFKLREQIRILQIDANKYDRLAAEIAALRKKIK